MTAVTPTLFLDFDGTITTRDAIDAILETYADPTWLAIEEAWKAGRVGSRECLAAQTALIDARPEQVDALLDAIEVDPAIGQLLAWCRGRRIPVHIVSDGFDYCIRRILDRPSLGLVPSMDGMRIVSSRLRPEGTRWHASFGTDASCVHGCATCKPAAMERLNTAGGPTIFVGDGLSDRYAAAAADLVFAKHALAVYCREHSIPYTSFDTLATVVRELDRLMASEATLLKAFSERAFPAT